MKYQNKRIALAFTLISLCAGCATELTEAGSKVSLVTESQRPSCELIGVISANQSLGPDKPGNALRKAMNQVASSGGNGFRLITSSTSIDGASVTGEALRCNR
jgi:hypothetical protein